jgi:hypothetical protein
MKNKTKIIKQKWAYTVTTPPIDGPEELNLWCRKSKKKRTNKKSARAELNTLSTVLTCLCGNHPWIDEPFFSKRDYDDDPGRSTAVTIAGPPRTGSTLVTLAVNEILQSVDDKEHKVFKTHELFDSRCPFLFDQKVLYCIRNPYDSFYSYLRYLKIDYEDILDKSGQLKHEIVKNIFEDIHLAAAYIKLQKDPLTKSIFMKNNNNPIILIPYEIYYNNEMQLIDDISKYFNIDLIDEQKKLIYSKICNKNIKKISDNLDDGAVAEFGYIHKNHVGDKKGAPGQGSQLPDSIKEQIFQNFGGIYQVFGYDLKNYNK